MAIKRDLIGVDEAGYRVGESHQNAIITNATVDKIRDLYEYECLGFDEICANFSLAKSTVVKICRYERRVAQPARWKPAK